MRRRCRGRRGTARSQRQQRAAEPRAQRAAVECGGRTRSRVGQQQYEANRRQVHQPLCQVRPHVKQQVGRRQEWAGRQAQQHGSAPAGQHDVRRRRPRQHGRPLAWLCKGGAGAAPRGKPLPQQPPRACEQQQQQCGDVERGTAGVACISKPLDERHAFKRPVRRQPARVEQRPRIVCVQMQR
eukprot:359653-Chlamydomonas_euryale.AAC.3